MKCTLLFSHYTLSTHCLTLLGLDVAQPGFEGYEDEVRLTADDADFVDVIHTNGLPFLPNAGFGFQSAVGMLYYNQLYAYSWTSEQR